MTFTNNFQDNSMGLRYKELEKDLSKLHQLLNKIISKPTACSNLIFTYFPSSQKKAPFIQFKH